MNKAIAIAIFIAIMSTKPTTQTVVTSTLIEEVVTVPTEVDGRYLVEEERAEPNLTYNLFTITNLTPEQFEIIAPGKGESLRQMEMETGVNGLLCLAIGQIESSWTHAANTHNYWGIKSAKGGFRAWPTLHEGIIGFGGYINQKMYHGKTIDTMASIYCPPTASKWARDVSGQIGHYIDILTKELQL